MARFARRQLDWWRGDKGHFCFDEHLCRSAKLSRNAPRRDLCRILLGPPVAGGAPQSSQRRFPHPHSNMCVMAPLSESTTVRTSFIFMPQIRQVRFELSSTTQILSARNISIILDPVKGTDGGLR